MRKKKMIMEFLQNNNVQLSIVATKEFYKKDKSFVERVIKEFKEQEKKFAELRKAFELQNSGGYTIPVDLEWEEEK